MKKLDEIRLKLTRMIALNESLACRLSRLGPEHETDQALATMAEETSKEALAVVDEAIELVSRLKIVRSA